MKKGKTNLVAHPLKDKLREKSWRNMSEVAQILNISGFGRNNIFEFLREQNVLKCDNDVHEEYTEKGLFKVETIRFIPYKGFKYSPLVSQDGVLFIWKLLKQKGIVK